MRRIVLPFLSACGGAVLILQAAAAAEAKPTAKEMSPRRDDVVDYVAFTPDGKQLAVLVKHWETDLRGYQQEVAFLDAASGKEVRRVTGGKGHWANTLRFTPDGRAFATTCGPELMPLWDATTGKRLREFEGTKKLCEFAFTLDGKLLVGLVARDRVKRGDNYLLCVWDVSTGKRLRMIEGNEYGEPRAFSLAADGEQVLIAHYRYPHLPSGDDANEPSRGMVRVWNLRTGADVAAVGEAIAWTPEAWRGLPPGDLLHDAGASASGSWCSWRRGQLGWWLNKDRAWCGRLALSAGGRAVVLADYRQEAPILSWRGTDPILSGKGSIFDLLDPVTETPLYASGQDNFPGRVNGAVLSPNGEQLATWKKAKASTQLLLWNLKPPPGRDSARVEPTEVDFKTLWATLAGEKGRPAHQAMRALAAAPDRSVALLGERLRPAAGDALDENKIPQWIRDLDDDSFEVRERASQTLARFGAYIKPTLQKARAATDSLEAKRRLDELLGAMDVPPTSEELRHLRAVDVLEQIGTKEARKLLRALAEGAVQAPLTRAATRALERLERQGEKD